MRKLLDQRILQLIKLTTSQNQRALFLIIGDNARDIVATLHTLLCNATHSQGGEVLWCYKKELATSAPRHIKRRKRKVAKSDEVADPLATFFASSSVTFTRYRDASRVLGRTFRMCVLQDFEGLTPNLLAQTVETVSGAGAVVFLLRNMSSLRQLSVTSMDFYARFRSGSERAAGTDEQSKGLVCRFIERFTLSLRWCDSCLVMDDEMTLLPLSAPKLEDLEMSQQVKPVKETGAELEKLKREMRETRPIAQLLELCLTVDQAKVLLEFVDLSHGSKTDCVLSLLASRGRGKTYACGLAVAYAILATEFVIICKWPNNVSSKLDEHIRHLAGASEPRPSLRRIKDRSLCSWAQRRGGFLYHIVVSPRARTGDPSLGRRRKWSQALCAVRGSL